MIVSFRTRGTQDVFEGRSTPVARKTCPESLWKVARRKLDQLQFAHELRDLATPPGNHLERLKGDRRGHYSIRINERFRVCFAWTSEGCKHVEIVDYH